MLRWGRANEPGRWERPNDRFKAKKETLDKAERVGYNNISRVRLDPPGAQAPRSKTIYGQWIVARRSRCRQFYCSGIGFLSPASEMAGTLTTEE
jgi:hypothetical protein